MKLNYKRFLKIFAFGIGILAILSFAASYGFNYWLKNNLPEIIKKRSPYNITYQHLDVDIKTGNITAKKINISNKKPNNQNEIGLDGSIGELKISSLGIWDALYNKVINTDDVTFVQPKLRVVLAKPKDEKTSNNSKQPILFKNIHVQNGDIDILKFNKDSLVTVKNLNLELTNFRMTEKDVKQKLPVVFDSYSISGENFIYRDENIYDYKAKRIATENGQMSIKGFELKPLLTQQQFAQKYPNKTNLFAVVSREMTFKDIGFKDNKISLAEVKFDSPDIKIMSTNGKSPKSQKNFSYDIELDNISLKNGNILMLKPDGSQHFQLKRVSANMNKIMMNEETSKGEIPFKYGAYRFETHDFNYNPGKYYKLSLSSLVLDNHKITVSDFSFLPTMNRTQFNKSIPVQEDLYTVKIPKIELAGYKVSNLNNHLQVEANNLNVYQMYMNIFSSNLPPQDPTPRTFFSEKFRKIKFPLTIHHTKVINSLLEYEETDKGALAPGKLSFANLNVGIDNINTAKLKGKNTMVTVNGKTSFFGTSPTTVLWTFDVANPHDAFSFKANINNLDVSRINDFIRPYLHVSTSGMINSVDFDFKGNKYGIKGPFLMTNTNLKVELLDDKNQKKKKFLSFLTNWFIKNNTGNAPKQIDVDYTRTEKRSLFNLLWRGIETGLKGSLIGDTSKIEKTVDDIKEKKEKIKQKIDARKQKNQAKKGLFNGLFKKKETATD
ncbi:hypothetical protein CMU02_00730 [Elizabethkingia anophelis]|uniref:hypothetical protein n=1 Tax=Elizabethkingia anophelis TaxID=1117645 RepID=UPI00293CA4D3|nr:hypothetical protein [Elizabethkingia anophelis]